LYRPAVSRDTARASAVRNLLDTFFSGSAAQATVALLGSPKAKFTKEELDRLSQMVEEARKKSK
jgi:predicted transcriptional regulator